jgi:hypothetical protein
MGWFRKEKKEHPIIEHVKYSLCEISGSIGQGLHKFGASLEEKAAIRRREWERSRPSYKQGHAAGRAGRGKLIFAAAGFGLIAGAAAIGIGLVLRRIRATRDARKLGIGEFLNDGFLYSPGSRDALPGEQHDYIDVEVVEEEPGSDVDSPSEVDPDAPPGLAPRSHSRRNRAFRRVAVRKKVVHETGRQGAVRGPFLSSVVAEARLHYAERDASPTNLALARAFMVREMKNARVTATDIDVNIDYMVTAVFYRTKEQVQEEENRSLLRRAGLFGGSDRR